MALGRLFVWLGLDKKDYEAGLMGASTSAAVHTRVMQGNFDRLNFKRMRLDWVQTSRILNFVGIGIAARMMFKEFEKVEGVIALKSAFQGIADVFVKDLTPAIDGVSKVLAKFFDLGMTGAPSEEIRAKAQAMEWAKRKIELWEMWSGSRKEAVDKYGEEYYAAWSEFQKLSKGAGGMVNGQYTKPIGPPKPDNFDLLGTEKKWMDAYKDRLNWQNRGNWDFNYSRMAGVGNRAMPKFRGGADNVFEAALKTRGQVGAGRKLVPAEMSPEMLDRLSYTLDEKVDEMEGRFNDFSGNVQASWAGAMTGMMSGSMKFADFSKEMFRSVEIAFFDMVARMTAQEFFDATLGKWAEKAPLSVQDALKYRTPGSNLLRGGP